MNSMKAVAKKMYVVFGQRRYPVDSFAAASERWEQFRDSVGFGASECSGVEIVDESGSAIAHISYNGRVWPGPMGGGSVESSPLHDNAVAVATA